MDNQQYELDENRFGEVRKLILFKRLPLMLLAMLGGIGISYFNSNHQQDQPSFWAIMVPIFIALSIVGFYRGIQRQKGLFSSYRINIDEQGITRFQATVPVIRLERNEIREIHKHNNGSYTVKGDSINQTIIIPAQIENSIALEEALSKFSLLVTPPNIPITTNALRLLPIVTIVLMVLVYTSDNKLIVAISGTLLLGITGYSLVYIQRSKHIDDKTKKSMWLLLLVSASVLVVMYAKLAL